MAEALRNLQIFRNGAIIVGSVSAIKTQIAGAILGGTLKVNDGEPVSIRYSEVAGGDVKGLYGVVYGNGTSAKVLWTDGISSIDTTPQTDAFVTLNHTEDENGNVLLTVAYTTSKVSEAGTITGYKNNATGVVITVAEYNDLTEEEKANYTAVEKDGLTTAQDVKDYVDNKYIGSKAIDVEENTEDKNVISIKVSDHEGNIIAIDDNGIYAVQSAATEITDVQVKENSGTENIYFTIDGTTKKIINGTSESQPVVTVEPGKRVIIIATSDGHLNASVLPETSEKYTVSGVLVNIPKTETEAAKTVIRFTYNTGETYDVDVTALVNTSHTKVEGETEVLNNEDYVSVNAATDTTTNTVTLASTVKTTKLLEATATDVYIDPHDESYDVTKAVAVGMYRLDSTGTDSVTVRDGHSYTDAELVTEANLASMQALYGGVVSDHFAYQLKANDGLTTAIDVKNYVDTHETQVKGENDTELNNTDYVNVKATRSGNEVTLSSSIKTAEMETAETEDGIATVKDVKEYVDGIAHTTVSAADETITVTETEVEGHKNFAVKANITEAVVERNLGDDSLAVTTTGTLNQNAMSVIENYIDNYDCGTFELSANEMATALTSSINNASTGEAGATTVNDNINVQGQAGSVVINTQA